MIDSALSAAQPFVARYAPSRLTFSIYADVTGASQKPGAEGDPAPIKAFQAVGYNGEDQMGALWLLTYPVEGGARCTEFILSTAEDSPFGRQEFRYADTLAEGEGGGSNEILAEANSDFYDGTLVFSIARDGDADDVSFDWIDRNLLELDFAMRAERLPPRGVSAGGALRVNTLAPAAGLFGAAGGAQDAQDPELVNLFSVSFDGGASYNGADVPNLTAANSVPVNAASLVSNALSPVLGEIQANLQGFMNTNYDLLKQYIPMEGLPGSAGAAAQGDAEAEAAAAAAAAAAQDAATAEAAAALEASAGVGD